MNWTFTIGYVGGLASMLAYHYAKESGAGALKSNLYSLAMLGVAAVACWLYMAN
jgi:cyanate permease